MNLQSHLPTGNDFTETVQIVGAQMHMRPTQFLRPNWVRPCFQLLVIRSHQPHLQHPWDQKQSDPQNVTKKCQKSVHGSFQHKTANQKMIGQDKILIFLTKMHHQQTQNNEIERLLKYNE